MSLARIHPGLPYNPRLLGFSDAGAILGLSPWQSPLDVWLRVTQGYVTPQTEPQRWGIDKEPLIVAAGLRKLGEDPTAWRRGVSLDDPHRPWLRCSLDAENQRRGWILEGKSHHDDRGYGADRFAGDFTDAIPEHELVQVQGYLHLTGAAVAWLSVLFGSSDHRVYRVRPDAELGGLVLDALEGFWVDHVKPMRVPPVDGSAAWRRHFERMHPEASGDREATPAEAEIARRLRELKAQREAIVALEDEAENLLRASMGDTKTVRGDFGAIHWSETKGRTDYRAIAEQLVGPEGRHQLEALAEQHRAPSYRRMMARFKE
ncbi:MAG: hypothetical protein FD160_3774 [Caulobacteraceae bacterium]|nr:MAG: hypothetical protein FD160_3774 [Caulobacteraceae bacterium]